MIFNLFFCIKMTDTIIMYVAVGVVALLVVLSIAIKLDKMVKIIIWNFILWFLCCSIVFSLSLASKDLWTDAWLWKFLFEVRYILSYLMYLWWMIFMYYRLSIKTKSQNDVILEKSSYLLFVPLTAIWLCIFPTLIYVLPNLCEWLSLTEIAWNVTNNLYLQKIIIYLPYIFIWYSLITILAFSDFTKKSWWGSAPTIV